MVNIERYLSSLDTKSEKDLLKEWINHYKGLYGAIFIKQKKGQIIKYSSIISITPDNKPISYNCYDEITGTKFYKKSCYCVKTNFEVKNMILVPIVYNSSTIGLVCVCNLKEKVECDKSLMGLTSLIINQKRLLMDLKSISVDSKTFSRDLFLANMSHEIRTPLNGIIGYNQLLAQTELNHLQSKYSISMNRCCIQLMHIINDVLDFSKLASGKMQAHEECFAVTKLIGTVMDAVGNKAKEKRQTIKHKVADTIPRQIVSDKAKITQVIINLIYNSIKFSDIEKDINLTIEDIGNNTLKISIIDYGIGISEEDQYKIFNSFVQLQNTLVTSGSGLGLAISKKIVELLGGEIWVKSEKGKGSTFSFTVPYGTYNEYEKTIQKNMNILKNKYVLVVDDNPDDRIKISELLFEWKMKPVVCASAMEGLRMAIGNRYDFEFGIVDICMPRMSGVDLAEKIKKEKPYFPLIAMSAITDFINTKNVEYNIEKPIDNVKLFSYIHNIVSNNIKTSCYIGSYRETESPTNSPSYTFDNDIKILLAEDNPNNQQMMTNILEILNYTNISLAKDGSEAIKLIKKGNEDKTPYDILLLDLRMPIIDGYGVMEYIKDNDLPKPKIIVITASVLGAERQKCKFFGVEYFITKPLNINELKQILFRISNRIV